MAKKNDAWWDIDWRFPVADELYEPAVANKLRSLQRSLAASAPKRQAYRLQQGQKEQSGRWADRQAAAGLVADIGKLKEGLAAKGLTFSGQGEKLVRQLQQQEAGAAAQRRQKTAAEQQEIAHSLAALAQEDRRNQEEMRRLRQQKRK